MIEAVEENGIPARIYYDIDEERTIRPRSSVRNIFQLEVFQTGTDDDNINILEIVAEIILSLIQDASSRIFYISGLRGNVTAEETIKTDEPPTWIGHKAEHLLEILSYLSTREPNIFRNIQRWAKRFNIPQLTAGYVGRYRLESNFVDKISGITMNSNLAGLGSRQVLALITQIFLSKKGDTILIEEPELSLHPEQQVVLQDLFSTAIREGKQIICSTHSPFFILSLSKLIKEKKMPINDIAIYETIRNKNGTTVKPLVLNKFGFIEGGVPSFMKVESDLYKEWIESLEQDFEEEN